jgi:hypothetical protein
MTYPVLVRAGALPGWAAGSLPRPAISPVRGSISSVTGAGDAIGSGCSFIAREPTGARARPPSSTTRDQAPAVDRSRQARSMRRATAFSMAACRLESSGYDRRRVAAIVSPSSYCSITRGSM